MAGHRRGSAGKNRHSTGSRRSPDDIKERLRTALQKADNDSYSPGGVEDACKDAGLDDATASRFNDMALYAAYAVNASVRKSGQSAFTWIPLQGTVHAAEEAVPEAGRPAFTQAFIAAVTGVLKHVEEQESLDGIDGPPDLAEGSRLIHNIMSSTNKVLRMAISGSGRGRAKSLRAIADTVGKTVEAMQLSSGVDPQEVVQLHASLKAELAAAKKLESRASQELDAARPGHNIPPSLKAAAEAVYAYQGPELQKEIADLQRGVLDAQQIVDAATEQLKNLNVDVEDDARVGDQRAYERNATRKQHPRSHGRHTENAIHKERNGFEDDASAEAHEDADAEGLEEGEVAAEQPGEGGAPASKARRPRKARRDRDRRHRRRGLVDGTQRREEATDIEEEEEEEEEAADPEEAGAPAPASAHAMSSVPAVATSPHSSLAEPPGFSPVRDGPNAEQEEGPKEDGGRPRRPKKRSGRREKERQARRSLAAAKEPEAGGLNPSAAFGDGFGIHDSPQAWAEDAVVEESKPQRGRRERGRRQRATDHEAPDSGQPSAVAVLPEQARLHPASAAVDPNHDLGSFRDPSVAQARTDQQVPGRRRARISKLKTVAGTLLDLQNDITDPITQAPLVDPVVAADGYTYERGSIQKHLAASSISPITGKPMSSALYDNRLVASLLARLSELPPLGSS